jgi:hypothetical protein
MFLCVHLLKLMLTLLLSEDLETGIADLWFSMLLDLHLLSLHDMGNDAIQIVQSLINLLLCFSNFGET